MTKTVYSYLLSLFLLTGAMTLPEFAEAKAKHSKVKKHKKLAHSKVKKAKKKKDKKVAKKASKKHRKIASVKPKHKSKKWKRSKRTLPKEYGTL